METVRGRRRMRERCRVSSESSHPTSAFASASLTLDGRHPSSPKPMTAMTTQLAPRALTDREPTTTNAPGGAHPSSIGALLHPLEPVQMNRACALE